MTTSQNDRDEMTFSMYVDCGLNKAATAYQMGVSSSTVAARVRRHSLRLAEERFAAREQAQAEVTRMHTYHDGSQFYQSDIAPEDHPMASEAARERFFSR